MGAFSDAFQGTYGKKGGGGVSAYRRDFPNGRITKHARGNRYGTWGVTKRGKKTLWSIKLK